MNFTTSVNDKLDGPAPHVENEKQHVESTYIRDHVSHAYTVYSFTFLFDLVALLYATFIYYHEFNDDPANLCHCINAA